MWIIILDRSPLLEQDLHQFKSGRFSWIVDIFLIGHPEERNLTVPNRLAVVVQCVGDLTNNIRGHGRVDLTSELDESRGQTVLASDPCQVEGIDRNTVPAQAGPGIECLVAEWLRLGSLDDLPDVDAH